MDSNYDKNISRSELLSHFEEPLFNLILEEVLTGNFKKVESTDEISPMD
jgi:hypothetical protein